MYENDRVNPNNWTGVIEDFQDPLENGRLRVRIFGYHNPDNVILPTDCLPWALVGMPVNASRPSSAPSLGDWVVGFFLDGESGQFPVVTHVLPGINTVLTKQPVDSPVTPDGVVYNRIGEPTTPFLGRGIVEYTAINISNNNRVHVCDISYEVNQTVTALKIVFGPLFDAIRRIINAVIGATTFDKTGFIKQALDLARQVIKFIKEVTSELKEIQKTIAEWIKIAQYISTMISYVLSLPARIAAFFKDCISQMVGILKRGIKDLFSEVVGTPDFNLDELKAVVADGIKAVSDLTKNTVTLLAAPVKLAKINLSPKTDAEAADAVKGLNTLVKAEGPPPDPLAGGGGP